MILHQLVKDTQTHTLNNVYKHLILNRHTYLTLQNSFFHTDIQLSRNSWKLPTTCHEKQFYIASSSALLKDAVNNYSYTATVIDEQMGVKIWYNYNEGETQKYLQHNLLQCHYLHHKPHMDRPVIKQVPLW